MDVLHERPSGAQIVNNAWGDGQELGVRNLWWPEGAERPFPRHVIPLRTALEGVEMAAEEGLLSETQIHGHVVTLLNALIVREAASAVV